MDISVPSIPNTPKLPPIPIVEEKNPVIKAFVKFCPDITKILDLPIIRSFPIVKILNKHIEAIKLYTSIISVAITFIAFLGLMFISLPALSTAFFITALISGSISLLFGASFIKSYFLQKKIEEENIILRKYQTAYQNACSDHLGSLQEQMKQTQLHNSELKQTTSSLKQSEKSLQAHNEDFSSNIKDLEAKNIQLEQTLKKSKEAATKSQAVLQEANKTLETSCNTQRALVSDLSKKNAIFTKKIAALAATRTQIEKTLTEKNTALQTSLQSLTKENNRLSANVKKQESLSQSLRQSANEHSEQVKEQKKVHREYKFLIFLLSALAQKWQKSYNNLQTAAPELQGMIDQCMLLRRTTIPRYQTQLKETTTLVKEAEYLLKTYKEDITKNKEEFLSLSKNLRETKDELKEHTDKLSLVKDELLSLVRKASSIQEMTLSQFKDWAKKSLTFSNTAK